ncbi:protein of unknown function [Nocardia cyriacigeorgica GUH-2]|uniref:Uncharacterized protein n=1 Tax=Nocardia cyriacigeorgica (strain GUH-2) TaxID=1127134 RepID=H6QYZ8_NOCCG|nr:protein of unknown function [Nocardia cyriacigeorgica GUH-2]
MRPVVSCARSKAVAVAVSVRELEAFQSIITVDMFSAIGSSDDGGRIAQDEKINSGWRYAHYGDRARWRRAWRESQQCRC